MVCLWGFLRPCLLLCWIFLRNLDLEHFHDLHEVARRARGCRLCCARRSSSNEKLDSVVAGAGVAGVVAGHLEVGSGGPGISSSSCISSTSPLDCPTWENTYTLTSEAVDGISIAVRHEDLNRCVYTVTGIEGEGRPMGVSDRRKNRSGSERPLPTVSYTIELRYFSLTPKKTVYYFIFTHVYIFFDPMFTTGATIPLCPPSREGNGQVHAGRHRQRHAERQVSSTYYDSRGKRLLPELPGYLLTHLERSL
jgi:hypothetical protein